MLAELDLVLLSRVQFALTIMFHYLFPPLSIGLGAMMVMFEGRYLWSGDKIYESAARFWTRIFAVNFAVGVVTGIVMEFQFGTNWATYSRFVGDVFGSALAAEGIFAFFLESGFLAVLVFGWDKVSPRVHLLSTVMVFLGSVFSATWIVIANSWQHTPAGFHVVGEGLRRRAEITDFWAMVFNPSSVDRLAHVLLGSLILGGFFVTSICAWYLLRNRHLDFSRACLPMSLAFSLVCCCLMFVSGHSNANMVAEHQPAKLAAFEGHFHDDGKGVPLYLIGWPDTQAQEVRMGIAVPYMLSVLVHNDPNAPIPGLSAFPEDERPPVLVPFISYHIMIGLGSYFVGITALACFLWWRGTLERQRWILWVLVGSVLGPYIANQAGWVATEVGRQPWVVYGLLKTKDAVSHTVQADQVLVSMVMFGFVYLALFALWLFVINEKIRHGPEEVATLTSLRPGPDEGRAAGGLVRAAANLKQADARSGLVAGASQSGVVAPSDSVAATRPPAAIEPAIEAGEDA